jgi:NADP-dependent 3-hydroxy acid dehydrogenase YdfG
MASARGVTMSHYFITGASSGIGAALAKKCLAAGNSVTAVARRADRLAALGEGHDGFHAAACDVTDAAALAKSIRKSIAKLGGIDCAILNAGMYEPQDSTAIDPSIYAHHMDVNYMGVVNALPSIVDNMLESGRGQLAIVSSVAGWRGLPRAAAYGPTKAALISLAESMTFDLAPRGIDIKVICPGFVDTESTAVNDYEMPHLISAETAADEILAGLKTDRFLIKFPRKFARSMNMLRWLPDRTYFRLVGARTGFPQR